MEIKTFGVIGAGQMGSGIAQVAAMSGLNVIMNDINDACVQRGMATIERFLSKSVEKGKLSQADQTASLARLKASTNLHWKRRSRAASRSMCLRYSSRVVAPIAWISPRASAGLRMLAASTAPSTARRRTC